MKAFRIANGLFMILITTVMLVPFLYVFTTSVMPGYIVSQYHNTLLLPIPEYFTLDAYKFILSGESKLLTAYRTTAILVIVGTAASLFFTSLMAYPLSRKDLKGRNAIMMFVFITMLINGGMIPTYLVVNATGLMNSLSAIIIPNLISVWNMVLLRNFFSSIPDSLKEAAVIDGAGEFTVLFRIIMPLALPAMATIGLFYAVWYWNDFYNALLYINESTKWTLQLYLRQILIEATPSLIMDEQAIQRMMMSPPPVEQVKMAAIIMATVPILAVYPFIQKYFVKGVMVGSVKG